MFGRASAVAMGVLCLAGMTAFAQSQSAPPPAMTLFENVRIFDGRSDALSASMNVLVRGNTIEKVSRDPIASDRGSTRIVAGGGRTLMPGLIDMHWHAMLVRPTVETLLTGDLGYINLMAGAEATDTLMRGFTTVRDVGGPAFGLKRAIDAGIVAGPRIYPSGAIITVTSGHGDFRQPFELPRALGKPAHAARPQHRGQRIAEVAMRQHRAAGHQVRGELVAERGLCHEVGADRAEVLGDRLPQRHDAGAIGKHFVALGDQVADALFHLFQAPVPSRVAA
ncbi:MAG: amidohydrolase family protein [Xanthobacteraceae bacterium]|nr:amidohydrolase family protein [Xanthobacteraceae bacterium]